MMWDAHCHLHDSRITDLPQQLHQAKEIPISRWVVCSTGPEDWEKVLSLSLQDDALFPAFGVHPWYIDNLPPQWESQLFDYLKNHTCFVGECGLDFEKPPQEIQETIFATQIRMAIELGRPLNIHCRKAWHRLFPLLKPAINKIPGFVIHAYSQNRDIAMQIASYGGFVSFACHILRPWNQSRYQRIITEIPLETILIETDAPDIPLYTLKTGLSSLSRLSDLALVAKQICEWKNISRETLSQSLTKAWEKLTS